MDGEEQGLSPGLLSLTHSLPIRIIIPECAECATMARVRGARMWREAWEEQERRRVS